jgi:hypothetical protein
MASRSQSVTSETVSPAVPTQVRVMSDMTTLVVEVSSASAWSRFAAAVCASVRMRLMVPVRVRASS